MSVHVQLQQQVRMCIVCSLCVAHVPTHAPDQVDSGFPCASVCMQVLRGQWQWPRRRAKPATITATHANNAAEPSTTTGPSDAARTRGGTAGPRMDLALAATVVGRDLQHASACMDRLACDLIRHAEEGYSWLEAAALKIGRVGKRLGWKRSAAAGVSKGAAGGGAAASKRSAAAMCMSVPGVVAGGLQKRCCAV